MDIWQQALQHIYDHKRVTPRTFRNWFQGTTLESHGPGLVVVRTAGENVSMWLERNHLPLIRETLTTLTGEPTEIQFAHEEAVGFEETELVLNSQSSTQTPAAALEEPSHYGDLPDLTEESPSLRGSELVPWYTFGTYVVGPSNEFAYNAAEAVSESPGAVYNPLFIHGGVGLGKTHLVHAVANALVANAAGQGEKKILYCTCEQFTNDFIQCVRNKKMGEFHHHYRNLDMLIIDDVQFLGRTKSTQEEFFHTFNTLYLGQRQILLTSDRPPGEIPLLQDRLRSRFQQGVLVDIAPPDFEMRVAILQKKAERLSMDLPEDVAYYLANHLTLHVRQLEGALASLKAVTALQRKKITLSLAQETLSNFMGESRKAITMEGILKTVSDYFGVKVEDLRSRKRDATTALARQAAMYLARELTTMSAKDVAAGVGKKDHTTVLHAVSKIQEGVQNDPDLRDKIEAVRTFLLER